MKGAEPGTDHGQQVAPGWQPAVVRNLHSVPGQVTQLGVLHRHLEQKEAAEKPVRMSPEPARFCCR